MRRVSIVKHVGHHHGLHFVEVDIVYTVANCEVGVLDQGIEIWVAVIVRQKREKHVIEFFAVEACILPD